MALLERNRRNKRKPLWLDNTTPHKQRPSTAVSAPPQTLSHTPYTLILHSCRSSNPRESCGGQNKTLQA